MAEVQGVKGLSGKLLNPKPVGIDPQMTQRMQMWKLL
jgi:hypothetical protein